MMNGPTATSSRHSTAAMFARRLVLHTTDSHSPRLARNSTTAATDTMSTKTAGERVQPAGHQAEQPRRPPGP